MLPQGVVMPDIDGAVRFQSGTLPVTHVIGVASGSRARACDVLGGSSTVIRRNTNSRRLTTSHDDPAPTSTIAASAGAPVAAIRSRDTSGRASN